MGILDIVLGRDEQGRSSKINMALIAILLWRMYKSATAGGAQPMPNPLPRQGKTPIPTPGSQRVPDSGDAARMPGGGGSLGDILGGGLEDAIGRGRGGMGGGGLGDILGDILGGGNRGGRGMPQGGGAGGGLPGGLGDILGQILRGNPGMRAAGPDAGGFDDLLKQLGPILGGAAAGGLLSGGLKDLVGDFAQHGYGDAAQSWVSPGDNVPVTPREIEDTFGTETISELAQQLGMPRQDLLSGLSEALPDVVNRMTPDGRLPTDEEIARWI
jgi:uncharacterized protein YidB (DUF937 family)